MANLSHFVLLSLADMFRNMNFTKLELDLKLFEFAK